MACPLPWHSDLEIPPSAWGKFGPVFSAPIKTLRAAGVIYRNVELLHQCFRFIGKCASHSMRMNAWRKPAAKIPQRCEIAAVTRNELFDLGQL